VEPKIIGEYDDEFKIAIWDESVKWEDKVTVKSKEEIILNCEISIGSPSTLRCVIPGYNMYIAEYYNPNSGENGVRFVRVKGKKTPIVWEGKRTKWVKKHKMEEDKKKGEKVDGVRYTIKFVKVLEVEVKSLKLAKEIEQTIIKSSTTTNNKMVTEDDTPIDNKTKRTMQNLRRMIP
jgi:hypothetical protein